MTINPNEGYDRHVERKIKQYPQLASRIRSEARRFHATPEPGPAGGGEDARRTRLP